MEQLRQFWRRLSAREQVIAGGGASLLVITLLVFYVWQPVEKERTRLRAGLPGLRTEARQMRVDAVAVPKLKSTAKPAPLAGGLKETVEQAASAHGLQVAQINPEGNAKLSVTLAAVPFDGWVKWLATLQAQHAIRLDTCRVDALPQPGMVKVQAVLVKG